MGFFSFNCRGCGRSIKAPYDLPPAQAWQNRAVFVLMEETRLEGEYDGYGCLKLFEGGVYEVDVDSIGDDGALPAGVWHQDCAPPAGKEAFGPSERAEDQGFWLWSEDGGVE